MQTDKTGVNDADPAENQTRRILLKLNSEEWSEPLAIYSCSIMQCKLCLPRETELAAYNISTSTLHKHVEGRLKWSFNSLAKGSAQISQTYSGAGCAISSAIIS